MQVTQSMLVPNKRQTGALDIFSNKTYCQNTLIVLKMCNNDMNKQRPIFGHYSLYSAFLTCCLTTLSCQNNSQIFTGIAKDKLKAFVRNYKHFKNH